MYILPRSPHPNDFPAVRKALVLFFQLFRRYKPYARGISLKINGHTFDLPFNPLPIRPLLDYDQTFSLVHIVNGQIGRFPRSNPLDCRTVVKGVLFPVRHPFYPFDRRRMSLAYPFSPKGIRFPVGQKAFGVNPCQRQRAGIPTACYKRSLFAAFRRPIHNYNVLG